MRPCGAVCVGVCSLLCCVIALPGRVAVHQQNVNPQVHVFEGLAGSGVPLGTLTTQGSVESVDVSPASSSNSTQGYLVAVAGLQEQENTGVTTDSRYWPMSACDPLAGACSLHVNASGSHVPRSVNTLWGLVGAAGSQVDTRIYWVTATPTAGLGTEVPWARGVASRHEY